MMVDRPVLPHKAKLLSTAHAIRPYRSFADLGGCWGVNGGYTFHAASVCGDQLSHAFIVDGDITSLTRERAAAFPSIKLVPGMLGSEEAREIVGQVDMVIMYDILLHQVAPNWDEFIKAWLKQVNMVVVYNQDWLKSSSTVRFVDHGLQWFKENVHFTNEAKLDRWFEQHEEFDPDQNKPKRDVHNFWQWGITPNDLVEVFVRNGFDLMFMKRYGPFRPEKPWIVNDGFVFVRSEFRD